MPHILPVPELPKCEPCKGLNSEGKRLGGVIYWLRRDF